MRIPLPLPWEIVTADVSLGGNEGACRPGRGGGWANNARCRKRGDLVVGVRIRAMTLHRPSNRLYLFPPTSETRPRFANHSPVCFAQLAIGFSNPPFRNLNPHFPSSLFYSRAEPCPLLHSILHPLWDPGWFSVVCTSTASRS